MPTFGRGAEWPQPGVGRGVNEYTLDMPAWPSVFKHLTAKQAWRYVHSGDMILSELSKPAKKELAGLSAFGKSGDQAEMLSNHVDPITMANFPPSWDPEDVKSGLVRLGVPDPEQNSRIPGYDPWKP